MPRVSAAYRQAQRDVILDAAETCFVRLGVAATRIDDIVAESGLSVGAIYRYFPSKDAITMAVGERYRRRDREAMMELQRRSLPIRDRILSSLRYFLLRPADRIAVETIPGRDNAALEEWMRWVTEQYALAQQDGLVRDDIPAEHIASQLVLTYEGLAVLLSAGALPNAEALLENIATVLADGFAPRPVPSLPAHAVDAPLARA